MCYLRLAVRSDMTPLLPSWLSNNTASKEMATLTKAFFSIVQVFVQYKHLRRNVEGGGLSAKIFQAVGQVLGEKYHISKQPSPC